MPQTSTMPALHANTQQQAHQRRHGRGFWIVTFVFMITMAFAAAPAPLYVLYQQRSGFSALTITFIFAAYAVGVVVSLFLAGHISDRFGRRRVIAPAILLNVVAALLFMVWPDLPGLLLARFISGLGIGMLTATATAHMTELHSAAHPGAGSRRAEVVSTAANIGGLGLGPLITGFLAEYAPLPLYTPYVVFAFLLLSGLLLIVTVPETVNKVEENWVYRPQRVVVPPAARGQYAGAAMMAFVGFAMFGFFTSLAPSFVSGQLGIKSHVAAGVLAFVVFAASAAFQMFSAHWARTMQLVVGLSLLVAGLILVIVSITDSSLPLLIAGGLFAGSGVGVTFKSAIGTAIAVSAPEARGEALAGLFLFAYIGMALPVVLLGLILQSTPLATAVIEFGVFMLALIAVTAVTLARTQRSTHENTND
ncbi:MFS transporter [Arthrobacter sp. H35-D1]|uniref:MFS transporter n=1 Tax=Arthrobacter sp. H35-D1 TaxID=3046202 RepID=UPI0024BB52FC|nr:MFS transporter [Arthrobacter sp. H35-D1]MDJ0312110.1 MFS transporter [Arthrobacter sp. H35-D1]